LGPSTVAVKRSFAGTSSLAKKNGSHQWLDSAFACGHEFDDVFTYRVFQKTVVLLIEPSSWSRRSIWNNTLRAYYNKL
jgi:hypothetical protein